MNNNIVKSILYGTLASTILLAVYFFVLPLVSDWSFTNQQNSTQSNLVSLTSNVVLSQQKQANSLLPVRLKIPRINVNALVEYVGLTSDGAMDVPKGPAEVAWYKLGSRPGEIGSAVIAGHSGWKNNKKAVFDNLNKLKKGDKIYMLEMKKEELLLL